MGKQNANITVRLIATLCALGTVALAIYAARPWGDNYAYQNLSGYLFLALMMLWAIAPYVYFYLSAGRPASGPARTYFRVGGSLLISLAGVAVVIDATLIHIDAQGGLIFLFLPIYQWLLIGLMELVLALWRKFTG